MAKSKSLRKFLQKKDKFGHGVGLNWNGGGPSFNTTLGGIASYLIFWLNLIYLGLNLKKLIAREGAMISLDIELTEYDRLGTVQFNKTEFTPYIHMSAEVPLEDLNQYISIEFTNWIWDPKVLGDDQAKTFTEVIGTRKCTVDDFPEDSEFEKVLKEDEDDGVQKICMENKDKIQLEGSKLEEANDIRTLEINIWMCKNVYDPLDPETVIGIYDNKKKKDEEAKDAILYGV